MRKDILFIMNNLNCGGAEKALISLLETIDYSLYNVDLLLFKKEGIFLSKVPIQVHILDEPFGYKYFDMPIRSATVDCMKRGKFDIAFYRAQAGLIFKTEKNAARCEQRVWKYVSKSLKSLTKKYDVAIGYLEKNPVYFCIDKINATKKIGFIHNDYDSLGMDPEIDKKYFVKLDNIVTVSKQCANVLKKKFPLSKNKVEVMYNIVSPNMINKMSLEKLETKAKGIKIVSLGRLTHQKGFEMAIESCKKLMDTGYEITWSIIGEGEGRHKLEKLIHRYGLKDCFILLGLKDNPYPFIREADIYVHPSRFEGKSIAIDEAKIMNKPIVATNFSTVKDQIEHEVNGIIVEMNSESIFKGIKKLIDNEDLRIKLITNLSNDKLGTESEIQKLYKLFEAG